MANKLFQLKKYLSIDDTAKLLSISLGESITNKDILDLILDNHISLKVKATHSKVKAIPLSVYEPLATMGNLIKIYKSATDDEMIDDVKCGENFTHNIKLKGDKHFIVNLRLNDYWLFPMIGGNRLAIENYKRKLNGQSSIDSFDGYIYLKGDNDYCKLYTLKKEKNLMELVSEHLDYDINNYIPATEINNDIELFIEAEEIKKFELSLLDHPQEKKQDTEPTNLQIEFIRNLLLLKYGDKAIDNPRNFIENKRSELVKEFQLNALKYPSGKILESWLKK